LTRWRRVERGVNGFLPQIPSGGTVLRVVIHLVGDHGRFLGFGCGGLRVPLNLRGPEFAIGKAMMRAMTSPKRGSETTGDGNGPNEPAGASTGHERTDVASP
jgi:hypothetical protein